MSRSATGVLGTILVLVMVTLGYFSLAGDSLTFDEAAHTPAGYSYLVKQDMRLNPEHPPLIKDLAGLPLLVMGLEAPFDRSAWQEDVNGQWVFGHQLFFESGNDPDAMMIASRSMMLIFLALIGLFIFMWARRRYGDWPAVFALTLFAFSPTFLAHGRYVTTDVGATFGFLFALYFFAQWLQTRHKWQLVVAGLAFGVAQLLKFSLIILGPLYIGFALLFWFAATRWQWKELGRLCVGLVVLFAIGAALIWPVYFFHTVGYPIDRQTADTQAILATGNAGPLEGVIVSMIDQPILKPYAQYLLGLSMVFFRGTGGNTTYFMGEVSATAWKDYFPIVFVLKVPLALLGLLLISLMVGVVTAVKRWDRTRFWPWVGAHKSEVIWGGFAAFYWLISIVGNLNIGLRHILPTFPFMYLLITWGIVALFKAGTVRKLWASLLVGALLVWYITSSILSYPFYLQYFNELAGGPEGGYRYTVDSNLDWGQDLRRLADFVEENNIENIKVAYFGGDDPELRLGSAYEPFIGSIEGQTGWMAISATLLMGGCAESAHGFDGTTHHHEWLCAMDPVAKVGNSIFVYYVE